MAEAQPIPVGVGGHLERPAARYPDARDELARETPFQLLVATILAARCTDERVSTVTPALVEKYPDAQAFAGASRAKLEADVTPGGLYRNKAKAIQEMCRALVANHAGEVPRDIAARVQLPGVARKAANVVRNVAFGIPSGVRRRWSRGAGCTADGPGARHSNGQGRKNRTAPDAACAARTPGGIRPGAGPAPTPSRTVWGAFTATSVPGPMSCSPSR